MVQDEAFRCSCQKTISPLRVPRHESSQSKPESISCRITANYKGTRTVVDIPGYSGVMPRADTCLSVEEVHLSLLRGPLFCRKTKRELIDARDLVKQ